MRHHEKNEDARFAPGAWFGVEARAKLDVSECADCHDGGKLGKVDVPRGVCLGPTRDATALVLPDGSSAALTAAALKDVTRVEGEDDGIGLGRGFHGHRRFAGASLAALLRGRLPAGTDPGLLFVVVTASDGYRSLTSGGEILLSRFPENVLLVDTEDGKPLFRKSGRLKPAVRGDFFVDRAVRNLAEVRIVVAH